MPVSVILRDHASGEFFDGTAAGKLLLKQCNSCTHVSEPPTEHCPACGSTELAAVESPGSGAVVAVSAIHSRLPDGTTAHTVVAIVEVDEGPWIYAQIVGVDPDRVRLG